MNLLEMNECILTGKKEVCKVKSFEDKDLILFKQMLKINKLIEDTFNNCESGKAFADNNPIFKGTFGQSLCAELFYAVKNGYYYDGVPSKLLYIINRLFVPDDVDSLEFVNVTLNRGVSLLSEYASKTYNVVIDGEEKNMNLAGLIENRIQRSVKLITDATPKVKVGKASEVYIRNVDRVAIIPNDIADALSFNNVDNITYEKEIGLVFNGQPLRTFGDRLGVTMNEFDLRKCF